MPHKGYKQTEERRKKMSKLAKERKWKPIHVPEKMYTPERNEKISKAMKGKKLSEKHKENLRKAHLGKPQLNQRGKKHWNWRGGITEERFKIDNSLKYKKWRRNVLKRDKHECINCHTMINRLEVDHIKPFSLFPKLRFKLSNGRTLCKKCHKKIGWRGNQYNKLENLC